MGNDDVVVQLGQVCKTGCEELATFMHHYFGLRVI